MSGRPACLLAQEHHAHVEVKFADKAVQGRQAGDGRRAEQQHGAGGRQAAQKSAVSGEQAAAGGMDHGTGGQKEQPLEQGVIPDMQ